MRLIVLYAVFLAVLISCAADTELTATHKYKSIETGFVSSMLIVGISEDLAIRKLFEETFAKRFNRAGVKAISSMAIIPSEKEMDKDTIKSAAVENAMETVLVTHLAASGDKKVYQPGPTGPSRSDRQFGNYYPFVVDSIHHPGRFKDKKFVKLVTNLYETSTEEQIWGGVSESIEPKSTQRIIDTLVEKIVKDMRRNNLIK